MPSTRQEVIDAEIIATGRRWCSSCQKTKPLEGGLKTTRMWRCKDCLEARKRNKPVTSNHGLESER